MQRIVIATLALSCFINSAFGGGQPIKDAPSVIHIQSGEDLKVLSITRTALHGSDEPAVSVQYVSKIELSDTGKLYSEAEQVFQAIRPLVEREKVRAAVVTANEPASGLISMSHGAGWCWKRRVDGSWGEPNGESSKVSNTDRPNQELERTATRSAFAFCVAKTSLLRAALALGGRRSACSR
jgi:hypothetical protein